MNMAPGPFQVFADAATAPENVLIAWVSANRTSVENLKRAHRAGKKDILR